jgi:hypothetical protein
MIIFLLLFVSPTFTAGTASSALFCITFIANLMAGIASFMHYCAGFASPIVTNCLHPLFSISVLAFLTLLLASCPQ